MRSGIKKIIQEFIGVIKGISKRIFRSTFNERGRLRYYEVRSLYLMFHRSVYGKTYKNIIWLTTSVIITRMGKAELFKEGWIERNHKTGNSCYSLLQVNWYSFKILINILNIINYLSHSWHITIHLFKGLSRTLSISQL